VLNPFFLFGLSTGATLPLIFALNQALNKETQIEGDNHGKKRTGNFELLPLLASVFCMTIVDRSYNTCLKG
jgi:hypothetical protein